MLKGALLLATVLLLPLLGGDVRSFLFHSHDGKPLCERTFARGEWATDVLVELRLSRPPALGQSATLFVEVCTKQSGTIELSLALPEPLEWERRPPGFSAQDRITHNPAGYGCLSWTLATTSLQARQPLQLNGVIRARESGYGTLTANASPATGTGDAGHLNLTIGRTPATSFFGFRLGKGPHATVEASMLPPVPLCEA